METRVFRWLGVAAGVLLLGLPLYGQADMDTDEPSPASVSQGQTHLGFPQDWSSRHLVIAGASIDDVLAAGNYDPRYAFNAVHRMVALRNARQAEEEWRIGVWGPWPPRRPSHKMKIDWAVSLENGYVAQKQFPAKYQFGITAESCSLDYIIFALTVASGTQANLVGINNLYTGASPACNGGTPFVAFAYNTVTQTGDRSRPRRQFRWTARRWHSWRALPQARISTCWYCRIRFRRRRQQHTGRWRFQRRPVIARVGTQPR